jgi:hypothetical protein
MVVLSAARLPLRNVAWVQGGHIGELARGSGMLANNAYVRASEIDKQHDVVGKLKSAATKAARKLKELDDEHQIVEKSKAGAADLYQRAKAADEKHSITARAGAALLSGVNAANKALEGSNDANDSKHKK